MGHDGRQRDDNNLRFSRNDDQLIIIVMHKTRGQILKRKPKIGRIGEVSDWNKANVKSDQIKMGKRSRSTIFLPKRRRLRQIISARKFRDWRNWFSNNRAIYKKVRAHSSVRQRPSSCDNDSHLVCSRGASGVCARASDVTLLVHGFIGISDLLFCEILRRAADGRRIIAGKIRSAGAPRTIKGSR